jgi:hypothetical protein
MLVSLSFFLLLLLLFLLLTPTDLSFKEVAVTFTNEKYASVHFVYSLCRAVAEEYH